MQSIIDSAVKTHIREIGYQFNAAIIGYDEGLLGNDCILAGAVWRRILQMECENPEIVENLVRYIRKSVSIYFCYQPSQLLTQVFFNTDF